MKVITLVQDSTAHLRMVLGEQANLSVLLCDQLLVHCGDFDIRSFTRQVEVRREVPRRFARLVIPDRKRGGFVVPGQAVEVEQLGELAFAVVGEVDRIGSLWLEGPVD